MSIGYVPKNELTANRALSAQELMIRGLDYALYELDTANDSIIIYIREPVSAVYVAELKIDGSNTVQEFSQANIAIVDSATSATNPSPYPGSGYNEFGRQVSDQSAIQLIGIDVLNPNDSITIRYKVAAHL